MKARRLQYLAQIPVYVAINRRLVGLIGIKQGQAGVIRGLVEGLRARGIGNIILTVTGRLRHASGRKRNGYQPDLAGLSIEDMAKQVRGLKQQGRKVALVLGDTGAAPVLKEADVGICTVANLNHHPGILGSKKQGDVEQPLRLRV